MTNKAYIVANEQQEREVLEELEREGIVWFDGGEKPTEWIPSKKGTKGAEFPYVLLDDGETSWKYLKDLSDEEIVYDGRKESKMKISKEVYDALVEWRDTQSIYASSGRVDEFIDGIDLQYIPNIVNSWWVTPEEPVATNNRLIAIIRWVNGEDVFKVEKPKKWIVRSKETDIGGDYRHVLLYDSFDLINSKVVASQEDATKFDTKEEAESWANSHQEVIQVEVKE